MNVKNVWIFPFLGSLISIIVLFTPTSFSYFLNEEYEFTRYFWMWGLVYARYYIFETFDTEIFSGVSIFTPEIFVPGLIATICILSSAVSCIITALLFRKGKMHFSEVKKNWLTTGVLYIISPIIYVVGMQIGYKAYQLKIGGTELNFWLNNAPRFGIIAPFIGSFLVIMGLFLGIALRGKENNLYGYRHSKIAS